MVQSLVDDARPERLAAQVGHRGRRQSQMTATRPTRSSPTPTPWEPPNFDAAAALRAMVKGATQNETGHGLEIERQYLSQYLCQHYVNAASLDLTSIDYSIGGSVTLEYAIDDFAIARLAASLAPGPAATMMRRAANWEYLFDPATGFMQARGSDGSFPPGPPSRRRSSSREASSGSKRATLSSTRGTCPRTWPRWRRSWAAMPRRPASS